MIFLIDKGLPIPPRRSKDSYDSWTDEEIAYLRGQWGLEHYIKIAERLGRGMPSVCIMAQRLGLRSNAKPGGYDLMPRPLTEPRAIAAARRLWILSMRRQGQTLEWIAKRLGLTRERIRQIEGLDSPSCRKRDAQKEAQKAAHRPCLNGKHNHRWIGDACSRCGLAIRELYSISRNLGA